MGGKSLFKVFSTGASLRYPPVSNLIKSTASSTVFYKTIPINILSYKLLVLEDKEIV